MLNSALPSLSSPLFPSSAASFPLHAAAAAAGSARTFGSPIRRQQTFPHFTVNRSPARFSHLPVHFNSPSTHAIAQLGNNALLSPANRTPGKRITTATAKTTPTCVVITRSGEIERAIPFPNMDEHANVDEPALPKNHVIRKTMNFVKDREYVIVPGTDSEELQIPTSSEILLTIATKVNELGLSITEDNLLVLFNLLNEQLNKNPFTSWVNLKKRDYYNNSKTGPLFKEKLLPKTYIAIDHLARDILVICKLSSGKEQGGFKIHLNACTMLFSKGQLSEISLDSLLRPLPGKPINPFIEEAQTQISLPPSPYLCRLKACSRNYVGYDKEGNIQEKALMVMRRGNKDTLKKYLKSATVASETILLFAKQMGLAVKDLHAKGIIHRDLKLENFIVEEKDDQTEVFLTDFGTTQKKGVMKNLGATGGSLPPEYLSSSKSIHNRNFVIDETFDMWAFGCVLYTMYTGNQVPWYSLLNPYLELKNICKKPSPMEVVDESDKENDALAANVDAKMALPVVAKNDSQILQKITEVRSILEKVEEKRFTDLGLSESTYSTATVNENRKMIFDLAGKLKEILEAISPKVEQKQPLDSDEKEPKPVINSDGKQLILISQVKTELEALFVDFDSKLQAAWTHLDEAKIPEDSNEMVRWIKACLTVKVENRMKIEQFDLSLT